jgi:NAD-dependent dihydropyrimidine dehydrogenase PreA subunit
MAYKITDECLACGSCLDACPNEAIIEGDVYSISDECADCGLCVDECPTGAIVEE